MSSAGTARRQGSERRSRKSRPGALQTDPLGTSSPDLPLRFTVLALVLLVFLPVLRHDFTNWDDPQNVTTNPLVMSPTWAGMAEVWTRPVNNMYSPLVFTTFMADTLLGQGQPWAFHLTNLLLHLGATAAVFLLLRMLCRHPIAATAGALLFALHPVQAEPVAWVTARKDMLAGCLALWAMVLHLRAWSAHGVVPRPVLLVAAAALFGLALLAKASVVAIPFALLVLQVLVLKHPLRPSALALLPWMVLGAGVSLVAVSAETTPDWLKQAVPAARRPLLVGYALLSYTQSILWPAGLAPVYTVNAPEAAQSPWSWAGLALGLAAATAALRHRGKTAAALVLFLAPLLPVLGFVPFLYSQISMTADRYLYVSMAAVALVCAWGVDQLWERPAWRRRTIGTGGAILALLAALTIRQSGYWKDSETLWTQATRISPGVPEAHTNLAFALHHRGDLPGAERQLRLAVEGDPEFEMAWNFLGLLILEREGPVAAIPALKEGVRLLEKKGYRDKRVADARNNLGVAYQQKKDHAAAEQEFRAALAIRVSPDVYANLAESLQALGRWGEARHARREAERLRGR